MNAPTETPPPPLPPFTRETAVRKVRMAEDAWNSRDPQRVALAYTPDSRWRNRIAMRFACEWHDDAGQWFRACGNEKWAFDAGGFVAACHASTNDLTIAEGDRKLHWPTGAPAGRPAGLERARAVTTGSR